MRIRAATRAAWAAALAAAWLAAGCDREMRSFGSAPTPHVAVPKGERQGGIQPGQAGAGLSETANTRSFQQDNAFALSQGKRFFRWYNCNGCHSNGGGGMGPPLMDNKWIYGHEPDQVFATIMEGRPNGMPSFRGRIPEDQAWQIVAYVRSMSGLASQNAAPARADSLAGPTPENRRPRLDPVPDGRPPEKR